MIDCRKGVPTQLGSRIPLVSLIQTIAVAEHLSFHHAAHSSRPPTGAGKRSRLLPNERVRLEVQQVCRSARDAPGTPR